MYKVTYKEYTATLTDKEYDKLLNRFNPENFKRRKDGWYLNRHHCICVDFLAVDNRGMGCWDRKGNKRCPLKGYLHGCVMLVTDIASVECWDADIEDGRVLFRNLAAPRKVYDLLLTAEKL